MFSFDFGSYYIFYYSFYIFICIRNTLCEQGVTIAMSNDPDIQNITSINSSLYTKSFSITQATNIIQNRLSSYNLN